MLTVLDCVHLASLHGRESDVSKELSAGGGCEVERSSVEVGVLLSDGVRVDLLENFIESKLAETLGRVAESSGSPAEHETLGPALSQGHFEAVTDGLVLLLVNLQSALDQIQGGDGGVGDATRENPTEGTESEVLVTSELAAVLLGGRSHQVPGDSLQQGQVRSESHHQPAAYLSLALRTLHRVGKQRSQLGHIHLSPF